MLEAYGHLEEYSARRQEERVRDGHIRPAYSFMWARGPSANRLLIFHLDRDRYWPALACGDDIFFYYKTVNTRRHRLKQPKFVLRCTRSYR